MSNIVCPMLSARFRPTTAVVYPPFKNGRYLEEYVVETHDRALTDWLADPASVSPQWQEFFKQNYRIIPAHWTYIEPKDAADKASYQQELDAMFAANPDVKFIAVVQHDDGPRFNLGATVIFGCAQGTHPIPEIYEDTTRYLDTRPRKPYGRKRILCSYVGSNTHVIRKKVCEAMTHWNTTGEWVVSSKDWSVSVENLAAQNFITISLNSKFAMAPRGYGRSSFRFFEILRLGVVPIYVYDDVCWLPLSWCNWEECAIVVRDTELETLPQRLAAIDEQKYSAMIAAGQRVVAECCELDSCLRHIITQAMNP